MRKIPAVMIAGVVLGSALLTAAPASADCAYVEGTNYKLIEIGGPVPITIYAPGHVDVTPRDCTSLVTDLVSDSVHLG